MNFRAPMSTKAADSSLGTIEASLNLWEQETLETHAKSGREVRLQDPDVVGKMPIDVMLNIFIGHPFVTNHKEQFDSLSEAAEAIMTRLLKARCLRLPSQIFLCVKEEKHLLLSNETAVLLSYCCPRKSDAWTFKFNQF